MVDLDSKIWTMLQSYRDLKVWRKGMLLTEVVYRLCRKLPPEERY